jgi:probable HAF family extracellular repeat protein
MTIGTFGIDDASARIYPTMTDLGGEIASGVSGTVIFGSAVYDVSYASPQWFPVGGLAGASGSLAVGSTADIAYAPCVGTPEPRYPSAPPLPYSARPHEGPFPPNVTYHADMENYTVPSSLIDLGTLGGCSSAATGVSGTIAIGNSTLAGDNATHAFEYDESAPSPHMIDLGTLGGTNSAATELDSGGIVGSWTGGGVVVGNSLLAGDAATHAFAYEVAAPSPQMIDLGTLGGTNSTATGVSGSVIIGNSLLPGDLTTHAFAYDLASPTPHMIDLGTLGGDTSAATSVSGNIVVGNASTGPTTHAFAYDLSAPAPHMTDLGTLGGTTSAAAGVSDNIVVGSASTGSATRAFAYDLSVPSPHMINLGTLGGATSAAVGVSGTIIVGNSTLVNGNSDAFVYDLAAAASPQITSVSPSPFSPYNDGRNDTTTFRVHVSDTEPVSFIIRNENGQTIQGPTSPGLFKPGTYTFHWDGRNNDARIAGDGTYTIDVNASDQVNGTTLETLTTATVKVDDTPPTLSRIAGNGNTFYPLCSACSAFQSKVNVNAPGDLWLEIDTLTGTKVQVVAQPHASAGTFRLRWNGRNRAGRVAAQGTYHFHFIAQDSAGNRRSSRNFTLHLSHNRLAG